MKVKNLVFALTIGICVLVFTARADAQLANIAMAELYISIMDACEGWLVKAGAIALELLAVTAVIGFAIGMKDLVLAGNATLDSIVAFFVRFSFQAGLMVWLLNAPQRLSLITMSIKKIGSEISGQDISFGGLITLFSNVTNPLIDFTKGLSWTDFGLIICMTFVIFLINCLFFMIASTVLVVEIEAIFILIGGLFTASFFVIGYFKDLFLGYVKALAAVGVKMLMLCLCLGVMRNIMSTWPGMIATQLQDADSVFSFLMPMSCALLGFYMIIKAVPQFVSSIMTGSVSGLDGGAVRGAAMAGYALGSTVISTSRMMAQKMIGGASVVSQAAQTYQYTSQAARDTGSTVGQARVAGAKEAVSTVMNGSKAGGSRTAGERIYSDQRTASQFADVRSGSGANTMSAPSGNGVASAAGTGGVTIAGSSSSNLSAGNAKEAQDTYDSSAKTSSDSWGSYASDKNKEGQKG